MHFIKHGGAKPPLPASSFIIGARHFFINSQINSIITSGFVLVLLQTPGPSDNHI